MTEASLKQKKGEITSRQSLGLLGGDNEPRLRHPRAEVPQGRQQQQQLSVPRTLLALHHFIPTASAHLIKGSKSNYSPRCLLGCEGRCGRGGAGREAAKGCCSGQPGCLEG